MPVLKQVFDAVSFWNVEDSDRSLRSFNATIVFPLPMEVKEDTVSWPLASAAHIPAGQHNPISINDLH